MTRDDYEDEALPYIEKQYRRIIVGYVDELEARIAELMSHIADMEKQFEDYETQLKLKSNVINKLRELEATKTCEGCKWHVPNDKYHNYCHNIEAPVCIRNDFNNIEDYYEPEDDR